MIGGDVGERQANENLSFWKLRSFPIRGNEAYFQNEGRNIKGAEKILNKGNSLLHGTTTASQVKQ